MALQSGSATARIAGQKGVPPSESVQNATNNAGRGWGSDAASEPKIMRRVRMPRTNTTAS